MHRACIQESIVPLHYHIYFPLSGYVYEKCIPSDQCDVLKSSFIYEYFLPTMSIYKLIQISLLSHSQPNPTFSVYGLGVLNLEWPKNIDYSSSVKDLSTRLQLHWLTTTYHKTRSKCHILAGIWSWVPSSADLMTNRLRQSVLLRYWTWKFTFVITTTYVAPVQTYVNLISVAKKRKVSQVTRLAGFKLQTYRIFPARET